MSRTSFPWEQGVLYIAIDPAQRVSAVAWRGTSKESGRISCGTAMTPDILDAHEVEKLLRRIGDDFLWDRVVLGVEYPTWNVGASQTVRAAANSYIRLVRRVFPKVDVVRVDPNKWQATFSFKNRKAGQSTKDFSLWVATTVYGWAVGGEHDRADAALILEHVRANPPAPKPKKVKKKAAPRRS